MNLLMDYLTSMIDYEEEADTISGFVSANLAQFARDHKNAIDFIKYLTPNDFMGRYDEIHRIYPGFKDEDYLRTISDPENVWQTMVEDGLNPNSVVKTWPHMLDFWQKIRLCVSPSLILETEESLDDDEIRELIELGMNPAEIDQQIHLTVSQKVKYGLRQRENTLHTYINDEYSDLYRKYYGQLSWNGLSSEELIDSEINVGTEIKSAPYATFSWYMDHFHLLVVYAHDKAALAERLRELVLEIYFESDISMEDGDDMLIEMMQKCIDYKLISVDDAVNSLYGTHTGSERADESIFSDEEAIRKRLSR